MVTATLTAAAVKSQITCQKRRLEALQATLSTMESGMDKHMLQVQVKYAQGYLESLREQLAGLQGHKLPPDTGAPDIGPTATADTAHPAAGQAAVASADARAESCAQHQQQRQLPEQYGCCVAAGGAGQQQQLKGGEECQGNTSHAAAEAAATPAAGEPDYEDLTAPGADSSLVDEDDWVCLQDTDIHTSTGDRSSWVGLWSWRKAGADASA